MNFKFKILQAIVLCVVYFHPVSGITQTSEFEPSILGPDQWRKEGQLVSIQISRGEPIRIFVVGREEAKVDLSTLSLTVRSLKPYPGKVLSVDKHGNYYVFADPKELKKSKEIEVITRVKDKNETFRFELK